MISGSLLNAFMRFHVKELLSTYLNKTMLLGLTVVRPEPPPLFGRSFGEGGGPVNLVLDLPRYTVQKNAFWDLELQYKAVCGNK